VDTVNRQPVTGWQRDLVLFLDRQIYRLAGRWLAVFNALIALYILPPVLAPIFMASGSPQVGKLIYAVYRPACHQLPERSFFLLGPQVTYSIDELWARGMLPQPDNLFARQNFVGAPEVGWKIALCERDIALYGGLLLAGLIFGLVRKRIRPLSLLAYALCLLPMAIDGGTQLLLLRESNWLLRVLTGGLVGISTVWVLYPHIETAFAELRREANERVHLD
jgi:uncharacterized membrane protein